MPRYVLLKSGEGLSSRPAAASPRPECYCCNDCVVNSLLSTRCDQASAQACAIFLLLARTRERARARVHEPTRGRAPAEVKRTSVPGRKPWAQDFPAACPSTRSRSNPSVHSLSVTLGNHAFHDVQTYNWPCPVGHLWIWQVTPRPVPGSSPQRRSCCVLKFVGDTRVWSSTHLCYCSASISRKF